MRTRDKSRRLPMNLQLFADGDGTGSPDTGGASGGTQDPNAGGQGGAKIQFTPEQQAEIDRIIAERVNRANKSAGRAALEARAKELGYESVEAMEAALAAHKAAQEKDKTDLQKAQEALEAEKDKARQAEERAKAALIRAAFTAEAANANLVDINDAFKLADLSSVTITDDGAVEGMKEAVEALVKAKPYLVKSDGGPGGGGGGNPSRNPGDIKPDDVTKSILARQGIGTEQRKSAFWS